MKNVYIQIAGAGSGIIASVLTFNLSCYAEDITVTTPGNSGPGMFAMISKVILFLFIILGLFYLIVKLLSKKNQMFQSGRVVKTWGGASLGQNKSIQLVEVGHRLYIVGVGDNVQLLAEIDDPEEIQNIRDHIAVGSQVKLEQLFSWTKLWKRGHAPVEEELQNASFQQVFHDKLSRITSGRQDVEQLMQDKEKVNKR